MNPLTAFMKDQVVALVAAAVQHSSAPEAGQAALLRRPSGLKLSYFFPEYLQQTAFRALVGAPPTTTLIATRRSQDTVTCTLVLERPLRLIGGLDRPNLSYRVWRPAGERDMLGPVMRFLENRPGPGFIYVGARREAETLCNELPARWACFLRPWRATGGGARRRAGSPRGGTRIRYGCHQCVRYGDRRVQATSPGIAERNGGLC